MPAFQYLKRFARACGKECIIVANNQIKIHEEACAACLHRAKLCPGDAVKVINLPTNLDTNQTHRYGPNSFKLHGLPTPRRGSVLGLLGANGIGKSTGLSILSGSIKANLGNFDDPPGWAELVKYFRGSELQTYLERIAVDHLKVSAKIQLDVLSGTLKAKVPVRRALEAADERGKMNEIAGKLELLHLLDRNVCDLSGGELQRLTIARAAMVEADVYVFDEPSSFLDIKQRMSAIEVIRSLVFDESAGEVPERYVIVVEHDLAMLDYVSDYVCCLYGEPSCYGVVTKIATVNNGINNYLAGYFPAENMRFRTEEVTFRAPVACELETEGMLLRGRPTSAYEYDAADKELVNAESGSTFKLHIEAGNFQPGEIIGLLGENGSGKTTFIEHLAKTVGSAAGEGHEAGWGLGVSVKPQHFATKLRKFGGTVQEILERTIQPAIATRLFRLLVLKPLEIESIEAVHMCELSGGQLQRVAIAICLGRPATLYLLDEPSAGLDCEQRIATSKVIRRWVVNHLGMTAFVIEHDFVMASALADRIVVYSGEPGVQCIAHAPCSPYEGFNKFLERLNVTIRRDHYNYRPKINKKGSAAHREQAAAGHFFMFDGDEPGARPPVSSGGPSAGSSTK